MITQSGLNFVSMKLVSACKHHKFNMINVLDEQFFIIRRCWYEIDFHYHTYVVLIFSLYICSTLYAYRRIAKRQTNKPEGNDISWINTWFIHFIFMGKHYFSFFFHVPMWLSSRFRSCKVNIWIENILHFQHLLVEWGYFECKRFEGVACWKVKRWVHQGEGKAKANHWIIN